jgi:hypothetical protein
MSFSERIGLKPVKSKIQIDSMDDDLRNTLWNCLTIFYWESTNQINYNIDDEMRSFIQRIWIQYFKVPVDTIPDSWIFVLSQIREYFFKASWNQIYDFIEFISMDDYSIDKVNKGFRSTCNNILEKEVSGYRFVDENIVKITSEEEIATIEGAMKATGSSLKPMQVHLKTALDFLSNRKSPDYRNSIKESISAVEAICKLITGSPKATLGQALKKLNDKNVKIHPALETAFQAMYGYTSEKDGIRHSLMDESTSKFMDAKFMLVSCSAFINLLIEKSVEAKIKL